MAVHFSWLMFPMTDIPEELVERVARVICHDCHALWEREDALPSYMDTARSAIRAVLDWQAKEWVEIPGLDRGGE